MARLSRHAYAGMYGPTVGDRVRLADTELWIEIEKDFTTYAKAGDRKTILGVAKDNGIEIDLIKTRYEKPLMEIFE